MYNISVRVERDFLSESRGRAVKICRNSHYRILGPPLKSGNLPDKIKMSWVKETKMKKTSKLLAFFLIVAMIVTTLVSCFDGDVSLTGTAKIVVENGENDYTVYEVDLSKLEKHDEGALSLLEYIASQEGSTLYYNVQWGGGYGAYVNSIGSLVPNPQNQYIALYTSESADFAVPTEYAPTVATVKYGDITLTYAGVGLSSMHINDGTIILFRLESF